MSSKPSPFPSATTKEIENLKRTLDDLLASKFADQSLLLGLNQNIQSKFQTWIFTDSNKYYTRVELNQDDVPNNQLDAAFNTIEYFDALWLQFHYPVVKFFQHQHAVLYNETLNEFNEFSKGKTTKERAKFKVKPVEMRKLYDTFNKFSKQVYVFYLNLLRHFGSHFKNPLVPSSFLSQFDLNVLPTAQPTSVGEFQANILLLLHRCSLSLGNMSRHRSFIEMSYVNPCLSNSNFWKFRNLTNDAKTQLMKPLFARAIDYYKVCILLLPALNEPYNHIGMIHNLIGDKYEAIYWFCRSQFTRVANYHLGFKNLSTILQKKSWFAEQLSNVYKDDPGIGGKSPANKTQRLNTMFMCLINYYYLPELYHNGANIVKNIKYSKVEADFFASNFNPSLEKDLAKESDNFVDFHFKQIILLSCFHKLIQESSEKAETEFENVFFNFSKFMFRYIEDLFEYLIKIYCDKSRTKALVIVRFVLSCIKENKSLLRTLQFRETTLEKFACLFNMLIDSIDSDKQAFNSQSGKSQPASVNPQASQGHQSSSDQNNISHLESQNSRLTKVIELIQANARPIRSYYFKEDVILKDFSLIKFQFKDFRDNHLFELRNSDLINGDYSDYLPNLTSNSAKEAAASGNLQHKEVHFMIPSFLENSVVVKLHKLLESGNHQPEVIISDEIENYEQDLRVQAILVLGKKLLDLNDMGIDFNYAQSRFVVKKAQQSKKKSKSPSVEPRDSATDKQRKPRRNKERRVSDKPRTSRESSRAHDPSKAAQRPLHGQSDIDGMDSCHVNDNPTVGEGVDIRAVRKTSLEIDEDVHQPIERLQIAVNGNEHESSNGKDSKSNLLEHQNGMSESTMDEGFESDEVMEDNDPLANLESHILLHTKKFKEKLRSFHEGREDRSFHDGREGRSFQDERESSIRDVGLSTMVDSLVRDAPDTGVEAHAANQGALGQQDSESKYQGISPSIPVDRKIETVTNTPATMAASNSAIPNTIWNPNVPGRDAIAAKFSDSTEKVLGANNGSASFHNSYSQIYAPQNQMSQMPQAYQMPYSQYIPQFLPPQSQSQSPYNMTPQPQMQQFAQASEKMPPLVPSNGFNYQQQAASSPYPQTPQLPSIRFPPYGYNLGNQQGLNGQTPMQGLNGQPPMQGLNGQTIQGLNGQPPMQPINSPALGFQAQGAASAHPTYAQQQSQFQNGHNANGFGI